MVKTTGKNFVFKIEEIFKTNQEIQRLIYIYKTNENKEKERKRTEEIFWFLKMLFILVHEIKPNMIMINLL